ncbi:hypothetical protein DRN97_02220 [Methanosarcinales archaeon]|nr:MAG: hypothetical protein DRN97_02220 [Methanosarcinales archaeon]
MGIVREYTKVGLYKILKRSVKREIIEQLANDVEAWIEEDIKAREKIHPTTKDEYWDAGYFRGLEVRGRIIKDRLAKILEE